MTTHWRIAAALAVALWSCAARADWPMLGHDAARTGATAAEVRPPFERKWYRAFPEEGLMTGVQPVVADGVVYVGTLRGVLHAIDAASGQDRWAFRAGGPVLHSCAASGGKVVFGCADGRVYGINAADGKQAWAVDTGAAVWNAPAIHDGAALVGSPQRQVVLHRPGDG
jgi:outer membrane protein assembly factor BamB